MLMVSGFGGEAFRQMFLELLCYIRRTEGRGRQKQRNPPLSYVIE